jgi:Mn-dependent DtxR family transcriptional regulator
MRELNKRLKDLLLIGIRDYIKNLSPIASGTIAKKGEINRSSATVRNELKILEELGYLRQLHTSGGRIPTTMGLKEYMESGTDSAEISSLSNIIIDLSNKIFEIKPENIESIEILRVSITPLLDGNTIILTKTSAGSISSGITTDTPLTPAQAEAISTAITGCLHGLNLGEVVCLGRIYTSPAPCEEKLSLSWTASALAEKNIKKEVKWKKEQSRNQK